jgi:predicted Rossmann fold flavoprotein
MPDADAGKRIVIVGGGAAAFFAAISCAETNPDLEVAIFERAPQFLSKVKISGGGRCNVTHGCQDTRLMAEQYPRGENVLVPLLHRFSPNDTENWFKSRGVDLKVEADGRMFPLSDSSQTVIDCFLGEAERLGIKLLSRASIECIERNPDGGFDLSFSSKARTFSYGKVLIATGGCRSPGSVTLLESLGHRVNPPVPSLFSFHIETDWLNALAGISLPAVEASVSGTKLRERGPLLITHNGLSGPVILRLSAWGARVLHDLDYHFDIQIKWLPELSDDEIRGQFRSLRESHPNRHVTNSPLGSIPARLWSELIRRSGIDSTVKWTTLSRDQMHSLVENLSRTRLPVTGKSLNKDEFVTCGGVNLREIDPKTMESRITRGLFFAGEVLDIDGITGGFNFQAAWTTGWIAGKAMAEAK